MLAALKVNSFIIRCSMFAVLLAVFAIMPTQAQETELINLDHLRFLTEAVTIDGRDMALVHIYSEYPDYEWVDAAGEGISAVDDVARAAIVYLWQYERTGASDDLENARRCLEFVRYMQAEDGEFYNFVRNRDGEINVTGNTSYKDLGWWAMRGLWALGEGVRVFDKVDPAYADLLAQSYLKTETALGASLRNYGEMIDLHGFSIPAWIPGGEAAIASIGVLGMSAYYQARPNPTTADILTKIADGIAAYRLGDNHTYPFGMHPVIASAPGYSHTWGAHMVHALAVAGMTLKRQDWIDSAAADADSFMLRQLAFEQFREIGVVPNRLGQIAYGTNMLVQGYMALYKATGEERYARYGGLAASWLFGNNMADVQMYDPQSGRVFDGINGPVSWRVNQNSGAESTIEGLMSLIAIADVPLAAEYMQAKAIEGNSWQVIEAESAARISGEPGYLSGNWTGESVISAGRFVAPGAGDVMEIPLEIETEDDYLLYVAHVRQVEPTQDSSSTYAVTQLETAPTIDGSLDEWSAVPALESNTREQFLRGAGAWQGAALDSHRVQVGWDADNLYLAVTVRDPQHDQTYILSDVWHGDAIWVYLSGASDARFLSAKMTLAQTPDGPQLWDWVNTGFMKGAALAWQTLDTGSYIYEAAIPWSSLRIDSPEAGKTLGIEVGRGVGGNSFMDLTGRDPDIASNLLPVVLGGGSEAPVSQVSLPVYLQIQLNDDEAVILNESISPDRDYWWLDSVWSQPVHLGPGEHRLRFSYAGEDADGVSKVDAFYLQPATARRTFQVGSRVVTLTYDTMTGTATWDETKP